jgi:hypothetical protein
MILFHASIYDFAAREGALLSFSLFPPFLLFVVVNFTCLTNNYAHVD